MLTYEERLNRDRRWALLEGSMHFEKDSAVFNSLKRITRRLDELGIPYALVGGMAMFLAVGYFVPLVYMLWSLGYGKKAGPNPWGATGLEWQTPSPPPTHNFDRTPVVTEPPYNYAPEKEVEVVG